MKQLTQTIFFLLASAVLLPCYAGAGTEAVTVPEVLEVPSTQIRSMQAQGIGVQIYECKASKSDPQKFAWVFKAPEANLYDNANKLIGKHYAGPTWESLDGSKVIGEVKMSYNSPDSHSILWLLLKAKSNAGSGVFSRVTSIQRLNTSGGKAPDAGCSKEQAGKEIRVPYKAIYNFYAERPLGK